MDKDLTHTSEVVHSFLEMDGALAHTQHLKFWTNLATAENTTNYLTVLIAKLLALDTGDKIGLVDSIKQLVQSGDISVSEPKSNSPFAENPSIRQSLLITIYFLALYYQHDPDAANFKAVLNKWINVLGQNIKVDMADEIIKMLGQAYFKGNDAILSLVDQCSNIDFQNNFESLFERGDPALLSPSLLNTYIRSCLMAEQGQSTPGVANIIFETILLFLKHPLINERRMLALLHMLKQFLIMSPQTAPEIMNTAVSVVKNYYLWPRPFGDVARDLLQLLTIELKSPGAAMRKRMLEENPELIKGTPRTGRERVVHMVIDQTLPDARSLQELIKSQTVSDVPIHQLQLDLLANILSTVLNCDTAELGLEYLSRDDALKFYEAAQQILNEAVLMKQEDAEQHRIKALSLLKDELIGFVENGGVKSTQGFSKPKRAIMPPLSFQIIPISCVNITPQKGDSLLTKYKYPKRSSMDAIASILAQYAPYVDAKSGVKPTVKMAIVGGESTLHNFIGSFITLKKTVPRSLEGLEIHFFFIPVEPSMFGTFLSRYDGWYGRHIYCLTKCLLRTFPSIIPQSSPGLPFDRLSTPDNSPKVSTKLSGDNDYNKTSEQFKQTNVNSHNNFVTHPSITRSTSFRIRNDIPNGSGIMFQGLRQIFGDDERLPTPSLILRTELENYFREARWKLEVNVYHCECWMEDGTYCSIPFFERVEFGFKPYAKFIQKQIPEPTTLNSVQSHKLFKWSAPILTIKCTQMNVVGVSRPGPSFESKPYLAIVISNIPQQADRGIPPNPSKPWLEMSLFEDKKRKPKGLDKELAECPLSSLHVSSVDIESTASDKKSGQFYVLLDNSLYGPFVKIRVGSCSEEGIVSVPFMTFFPIDLPS